MAKMTKGDDYGLFKKALRSGEFGRMYVLHGDEPYLVDSCRRELRKKIVSGPAEEFNDHRFTQENWNVDAFSQAMEALPMMSERSLVEVTDVDLFTLPQPEREQMAALLGDVPDYCTLLFVYDAAEWKPDKRMKKLWGAVAGSGQIFALNKQMEKTLILWIQKSLAKEGKEISEDVCRYLILQTGGSMTAIDGELQKLSCYTDQPAITKNDVDDVVIPVLEAVIFDITKDIGSRNFGGALEKLENLLAQDTEPIAVCAVIGRQFRQMYGARLLFQQGKTYQALSELCGIRDFAAREVWGQARGYSKGQLKAGMALCAETDFSMKTSGGDGKNLLRELVLRLSREETT